MLFVRTLSSKLHFQINKHSETFEWVKCNPLYLFSKIHTTLKLYAFVYFLSIFHREQRWPLLYRLRPVHGKAHWNCARSAYSKLTDRSRRNVFCSYKCGSFIWVSRWHFHRLHAYKMCYNNKFNTDKANNTNQNSLLCFYLLISLLIKNHKRTKCAFYLRRYNNCIRIKVYRPDDSNNVKWNEYQSICVDMIIEFLKMFDLQSICDFFSSAAILAYVQNINSKI